MMQLQELHQTIHWWLSPCTSIGTIYKTQSWKFITFKNINGGVIDIKPLNPGPRSLPPPVFDLLQYAYTEGEGQWSPYRGLLCKPELGLGLQYWLFLQDICWGNSHYKTCFLWHKESWPESKLTRNQVFCLHILEASLYQIYHPKFVSHLLLLTIWNMQND